MNQINMVGGYIFLVGIREIKSHVGMCRRVVLCIFEERDMHIWGIKK